MARLLALVSLLAAIASAGCSTVGRLVPYSPALVSPTVKVIELGGLYNVTLLIGAKPVLVDTGPPEAFDDLVKALAAEGIEARSLALVVLTHGHSDHAGGAARLQALGVPVFAHEGDLPYLESGDHDQLFATNFEAVFAQPFISPKYPKLVPDVVMRGTAPLSLEPYGLDAEVVWAGGHTPGSIVVHASNGAVVLGDLIRGGWLGGLVGRNAPATHLYHAWPVEEGKAQAEGFARRVARCEDVKVAFVGHGGPIPIEALRSWAGDDPDAGSCPW
ncbi:MAG: MBL fold metallo-hydrolase [Polyangiaceae bacterium]